MAETFEEGRARMLDGATMARADLEGFVADLEYGLDALREGGTIASWRIVRTGDRRCMVVADVVARGDKIDTAVRAVHAAYETHVRYSPGTEGASVSSTVPTGEGFAFRFCTRANAHLVATGEIRVRTQPEGGMDGDRSLRHAGSLDGIENPRTR